LNLNSLRGSNNILLTAQKNWEERELLEQLTQIQVWILDFGTTILEESKNIQIWLHNNSGKLFVYVKATEGKKKNIWCVFDEKWNQILPWWNYSNAEICIFKINGQIIFRISNFQGFYFFCPRQGYLWQIEWNQKVYKAMNSANLDNYQDLWKIHW